MPDNDPMVHCIDVGEIEGQYPGRVAADYRPVFVGNKLVGLEIYLYLPEEV